jgi:hypothetical protein
VAHIDKAGRNDACPCGSGKKYKKCCALKAQRARGNTVMLLVVGALMVAGLAAGISSFMNERGHTARPGVGGVWSPEHGHYH